MDLLIILFGLAMLILQFFTMRSVRSVARDQKLDSPSTGRNVAKEDDRRDFRIQSANPSVCPSSELDLSPSETPKVEKDTLVASKVDEPRLSSSDPKWQWQSYEELRNETGRVVWQKKGDNIEANLDDDPFAIYYLLEKKVLKKYGPCSDNVMVSMRSSSLIGILRRCLPDHSDLKSVPEPKVAGKDLFLVLEKLKSHATKICTKSGTKSRNRSESSKDLVNIGPQPADTGGDAMGSREVEAKETVRIADPALEILDLEHLLRFLEVQYGDLSKIQARLREEKRVSWDMLWMFLTKGTKVGYRCRPSGDLLCAVVIGGYYDERNDSRKFKVELEAYNYNGVSYRPCQITRSMDEFHQERDFLQLQVCPIENWADRFRLEKKFLRNGERFSWLSMKASNRYMCYDGSMYEYNRWSYLNDNEDSGKDEDLGFSKHKADGRVMIDLCSFAAMNPNCRMGSARPPSKLNFELEKNEEEVSDKTLLFAPGIVYGFSFELKKWGCFAVPRFSPVKFDKEAFRDLVMEPSLKSLLHNLVKHYTPEYTSSDRDRVDSSEHVDPIAGKGQGCIVLCHGPPGTGKTLTAESIAESLNCPLWALSVSELGTTPSELEDTLGKTLDIAALWKAVLLLDEADVYMEQRTLRNSVIQNAMTGVFLRQLEYYHGILFLTTNRVCTIDNAFHSRVSVLLRYHELQSEERAQIWGNLLRRADVDEISGEICTEMASRPLNGRQIRQTIRTAQVWAKSTNEGFSVKHIKFVMGALPNDFSAFEKAPVSPPTCPPPHACQMVSSGTQTTDESLPSCLRDL